MSETVRYTSSPPGPASTGKALGGRRDCRLDRARHDEQGHDRDRQRRELQPELERLHERDGAHAACGDDDRDEQRDRDEPTQLGRPVVIRTVSAAPCSCGTM